MKVLIAGAAGQLARSLVECVPEAVELAVPDEAEFDLMAPEKMREVWARLQPDCVINAAAYTAVDLAESEPEAAFAINAEGAARLAELCAANNARLLHVSTDYVFDGNASRPWKPDDEPRPLGVYGKSKLEGEFRIRERLPEATILRTAWLYSRHGGNFVKTMLDLLAARDEVAVVSDQVGAPTWAGNLARILWAFVARPTAGIFHYTDAGVASWYDFATAIAEEGGTVGLLKEPARVVPTDTASFPRPVPRPAWSVLDCRSTHTHTGIAPEHWRVALRRMLAGMAEEGAK
ncbi:MAG: dTDP-4-dehydrorhamnose reductase [Gammaproteobacteria bacterium]